MYIKCLPQCKYSNTSEIHFFIQVSENYLFLDEIKLTLEIEINWILVNTL